MEKEGEFNKRFSFRKTYAMEVYTRESREENRQRFLRGVERERKEEGHPWPSISGDSRAE